jgi:hypothetical protein
MTSTDQPYREFAITDEHVSKLRRDWQWGVKVDELGPEDFFDGVSWFDDEQDARNFADEVGLPVVRQQRIWWSGEWEAAPAAAEAGESR